MRLRFELRIDLENDAYKVGPGAVADLLMEAAERVGEQYHGQWHHIGGLLLDENGNEVGGFGIAEVE